MYCEVLKNNVKYYKETEEGQNIMCQVIEELADKRAETKRIDTSLDLVKNLMDSMNWTAEKAMKALKITEGDRAEILKRM
jgi:NACalpha-BTF3-like transcription factor